MTDPTALMRLHVETLFTHDADGALLTVNEPGGGPAPRFFLGSTPGGDMRGFRSGLDADLVRGLHALCDEASTRRPDDGPVDPSPFVDLLGRRAPVEAVWAGPTFRFPSTLRADDAALLLDPDRSDTLRPHFADWSDDVEACAPFVALESHGGAVSICCSVRRSAGAHEAGVETAPGYRRRGYAARVVASWAAHVRDLGAVPLYSTSWVNDGSLAVADALALVRYGTTLHIT